MPMNQRFHSMDDIDPHYGNSRAAKLVSKPIYVYRNGDYFYPSRKFIVSNKSCPTFGHLCEQLTNLVKPVSGAIGRLYTPSHGTRVKSLEDITAGLAYVAAGRKELFKQGNYYSIRGAAPMVAGGRVQRPPTVRLNVSEGEGNRGRTLSPRREAAQANSLDELTNAKGAPKIIHVFRNGDEYSKPVTVFLRPLDLVTLPRVWSIVSDKVKLLNTLPIRRLYHMDKRRVKNVEEIENGAYYVAASREKYLDVQYGRGLPAMHLGTKNPNLLGRSKYLNQPATPNRRRRLHQVSKSEGDTPNNGSTQGTQATRSKYVNEQGILAKPVRFTKNRSDKKTTTGHDGSQPQQLSERQKTYVVQQDGGGANYDPYAPPPGAEQQDPYNDQYSGGKEEQYRNGGYIQERQDKGYQEAEPESIPQDGGYQYGSDPRGDGGTDEGETYQGRDYAGGPGSASNPNGSTQQADGGGMTGRGRGVGGKAAYAKKPLWIKSDRDRQPYTFEEGSAPLDGSNNVNGSGTTGGQNAPSWSFLPPVAPGRTQITKTEQINRKSFTADAATEEAQIMGIEAPPIGNDEDKWAQPSARGGSPLAPNADRLRSLLASTRQQRGFGAEKEEQPIDLLAQADNPTSTLLQEQNMNLNQNQAPASAGEDITGELSTLDRAPLVEQAQLSAPEAEPYVPATAQNPALNQLREADREEVMSVTSKDGRMRVEHGIQVRLPKAKKPGAASTTLPPIQPPQ